MVSCWMLPASCFHCDQVPVIATLFNVEGHIVYQNEASLSYWGLLVKQQNSNGGALDRDLVNVSGNGWLVRFEALSHWLVSKGLNHAQVTLLGLLVLNSPCPRKISGISILHL